jgi:hypothetical protein
MKKAAFANICTGLLLAAVFLSCGRAYAAGSAGASFLKVGWGARPAAMGEAYTGLADDIDAIYWNPAGLTYIKRQEQTFAHNSWLEAINVEYAAMASRLNARSVAGAGIEYMNVGDIARTDRFGYDAGYYSANDLALMFSYARVLKPGLSAGATLKIVNEKLEAESARAFALDVGAIYEKPKIRLGLSIKNLGTGLTFVKEATPLPMVLRLGASYKLGKNMLLASDVSMPFDDSLGLHFGAEYIYPKVKKVRLALRAGFKTAQMAYLGAMSAISLGFGVESGNYGLDYALAPYGDLGMTHRISLKIKFNALAGAEATGEIVVEKAGKKMVRNTETAYQETLQWFDQKVAAENLAKADQILILEKIQEKFLSMGVDVALVKEKLSVLKNAPK